MWRRLSRTDRDFFRYFLLIAIVPIILELYLKFTTSINIIKSNDSVTFTIEERVYPGGKYYLNAGRPRGLCQLRFLDKPLISNYSQYDRMKTTTFLSTSILVPSVVSLKNSGFFSIHCKRNVGFDAQLGEVPILTKSSFAYLFSIARDFFLGIFSTSIIFLTTFACYFGLRSKLKRRKLAMIFCLVALIYSLSISLFLQLIFNVEIFYRIHTSIRIIFGAALCFLVTTSNKNINVRQIAPIALIALIQILASIFSPTYYNYYQAILPVLIATLGFLSIRQILKFEQENQKLYIATFGYSLLGWYDYSTRFFSGTLPQLGSYGLGVFVVAVLASQYFRFNILSEKDRLILGLRQSLRFDGDPLYFLHSIKAYLESFREIDSFGIYMKSQFVSDSLNESEFVKYFNSRDIGNNTKFGTLLENSISTQSSQIGYFNDGIGLILNFSNQVIITIRTKAKNDTFASSLLLLPSNFMDLEKSLMELSARTRYSLANLRPTFETSSSTSAVSFIMDINNYSKMSQTYGENFVSFVCTKYFPALWKSLERFANPETFVGDEFVGHIINLPNESEIEWKKRIHSSLVEIQRFQSELGYELCKENGYPKISLSSGCALANCNIDISGAKIIVSSKSLSIAKRLCSASLPEEILVDISLLNFLGITPSHQRAVVIKKDILQTAPFPESTATSILSAS